MSRCFELTTRRPSKKKTKLKKGNRGSKTPMKGWGDMTERRNKGMKDREGRQRRNVTTMRGRNKGRQRRIVTTTRGYRRK